MNDRPRRPPHVARVRLSSSDSCADCLLAPFVRLAAALRLLHPAALAGMRTVRLDRHGDPYPADVRLPDFTIATIEELLSILSGPYTRGLIALRDTMSSALGWREGTSFPRMRTYFPRVQRPDEARSSGGGPRPYDVTIGDQRERCIWKPAKVAEAAKAFLQRATIRENRDRSRKN